MEKNCCEDFCPAMHAKPIIESGQFCDGKYNINYSSILTKLIQEAGRWCKSYASDLFIAWNNLNRKIETGTLERGSYLFGFRELGVDSADSILSKYANNGYITPYEYRSIWRLDVEVSEPESYGSKGVRFTLYEVSRT